MNDLYALLEVPREADAEAIRKAYRGLARRYHPDLNPGDAAAEQRFKEISEAYAVLSDEDKRRSYDEFGAESLESGFDPEAARRMREAFGARFGGPGAGHAGDPYSFGDLDDVLSGLFGRTAHGSDPNHPGFAMRGPDVQAELELDFLEAARGGEKRLHLARPSADGGVVQDVVTVRIPPGVADGGRIRLRGKGGAGLGAGPAGDLYAHVRVRPHAFFRREGSDLHLTLPVTLSEAVLGAKVEVPTLDGRATVTIPPGTDGGARLRLKGKGVSSPGGAAPGDLYVEVRIRIPRDLDDDARSDVERMARFEPESPREELFR